MKSFLIFLGILLALLVVGVLAATGLYNGLVNQQQAGAANFEKTPLAEVTAARASVGRGQIGGNGAPDAAQLAEFEKAQGALSSALSRLLVVSERYPDLKATAGFRDLQAQLEGTENRIAVERGRFNDTARAYNSAIRRVPAVFFAAVLGFKEKAYFAAVPGAEKPPQVQFDFGGKAPANP